jgi:hypothetical protein
VPLEAGAEKVNVAKPLPGVAARFCGAPGGVATMKFAITLWLLLIETVHMPVPEQPAPVQPLNSIPASGVAVSVTLEFAPKPAEQIWPQLMPAGLDVTVPVPAPVFESVSVFAAPVEMGS